MDMTFVQEDRGYRWLLAHDSGADGLLARAATVAPDEESCRAAACRLREAPSEAIVCVQQQDGRWRWRLAGPDGTMLAESAVAFADAPTCRLSALLMQRVLADPDGVYALTGI